MYYLILNWIQCCRGKYAIKDIAGLTDKIGVLMLDLIKISLLNLLTSITVVIM